MKPQPSYFTTYDLNLSCTLHALGFSIDKIERKANRGLFFFKESSELLAQVDNYFKEQVTLKPQAFANSLKAIKNRLYGSLEDRG
jgi:hypothetical protein